MVIIVGDEVLQEDLQVGFWGGHALDDVIVGKLIRLEHIDHGEVFRADGIGQATGSKIEHGNER